MRTLVILPTYNERQNLGSLVPALLRLGVPLDVLIVDDNSPDGTGEIADALAVQDGRVHVVHRSGKLGLGTAYVAGFEYALARGYDRVVEMDADFSHRPDDLVRLLDASTTADLVIGSRNISGGRALDWSPVRHLVSKGGSGVARLILGLPMRDCTSGFKVFRRGALERLDLTAIGANGYGFQVVVNYACVRSGLRIREVPIIFPDRVRGTSKMSSRIVLEAIWLLLRLRLGLARVPLRAAVAAAAALEPVSGVPERETIPA
jgi:dolichol-phosphate mannosyltransferase